MAACLHWGPDAAVSLRAAAVLRGLVGFKRTNVEVTVPKNRNRSRSDRVVIHWSSDLIPEEDLTTIDGIPVTTPARTLLDLATVEPEVLIERCLDDALRRRLVSLRFLKRWLDDPRRQRHRGLPMLKRLVAARARSGPTHSPLETDVLQLLTRAGLPTPELQHEVYEDERFVGRLDFAYPEQLVGIEADGYRHHDHRGTFDDERRRGNELAALGWNVLRLTSKHLEENPSGVATWVRRALERSG